MNSISPLSTPSKNDSFGLTNDQQQEIMNKLFGSLESLDGVSQIDEEDEPVDIEGPFPQLRARKKPTPESASLASEASVDDESRLVLRAMGFDPRPPKTQGSQGPSHRHPAPNDHTVPEKPEAKNEKFQPPRDKVVYLPPHKLPAKTKVRKSIVPGTVE